MAWIESHQSLARHRKTLKAAALLHADRHKLIGHLHELWWWGLDNVGPDGEMGDTPPETIASAAGWPAARAQAFVDGMVEAGFIDRTEHGLALHDWWDYAGKLIAQRAANRKRMSDARAAHVQRTNSARAPATNQPTVPTNQPNPPTAPAGGAGVAEKHDDGSVHRPLDASNIVMADLRGPPYDIIGACEVNIGRMEWDWIPLLAEMKHKYSVEELEYGFAACLKSRGKSPAYVKRAIENRRQDSPGPNQAGAGAKSVSVLGIVTSAEYKRILAEQAAGAGTGADPGGQRAVSG